MTYEHISLTYDQLKSGNCLQIQPLPLTCVVWHHRDSNYQVSDAIHFNHLASRIPQVAADRLFLT